MNADGRQRHKGSGEAAWWAAAELTDLIDGSVEELDIYQPNFRYEVVDEVNLPLDLLNAPDSPVAGMIQVERARTPSQLRSSLRQFLDALGRTDLNKLAPDVETWLRRVIRPKRFQELNLESLKELSEVATMLEERVKQWEQELLEQGETRGHFEGLKSAFEKQFRLKFQRDLKEEELAQLSRAAQERVETLLGRILTAQVPAELFVP